MELDKEIFEEAAERVCGNVRETYSGRGMGDRSCPGVVVEWASEVREFHRLIEDLTEDTELAREIEDLARTDNMGRGVIVYFPGLVLT